MTVTISRLYDNHNDAQQAVRRLEAAGVPHSDISIVANNSDSWFNTDKKVDRDRDGVDDRAEGAGKGAGIGAGVGGTAGLLAGLGLLAIPGLGPVVAAGWLAATAVGAAAGAAPAVLSERSRKLAFPKKMLTPTPRASVAAARWCQRGSPTRIVPVSTTILNESAVNLRDRSAAWQKAGWKSFDPASKPYGAEEVRKERQLYGGALR